MNTPEQTGPALYEEITLIGDVGGEEPVAIDMVNLRPEQIPQAIDVIVESMRPLAELLLSQRGLAIFSNGDSVDVVGVQRAEPCAAVEDSTRPAQVVASYVEDNNAFIRDVFFDILAERQRQIAKGYSAEHDEGHAAGEMAHVAASLCVYGSGLVVDEGFSEFLGWGLAQKHGGDRRKQLVIAAALIVAEIQRLDRVMAANIETAQRMRGED